VTKCKTNLASKTCQLPAGNEHICLPALRFTAKYWAIFNVNIHNFVKKNAGKFIYNRKASCQPVTP
jgi:hypothetical protein